MNNRFYPLPTLPFQNPDWKQVETSTLKGETRRLVEHAQKLIQETNDTSVDGPWWVEKSWSISDFYTILIMAIFVPPIILLWPVIFACCLLPVHMNHRYICDLPAGCDTIPRERFEWKLHLAIQFVTSLPVQFLAMITLLYSNVVITVFGCLYLLVSSIFRRKSPIARLLNNLDVVAPYQQGPNLYLHFEDCVVAVAGSVHRQGLMEFTVSFATMFIVNPWMKYWITGNLFLED
jgi:hypothetical protein